MSLFSDSFAEYGTGKRGIPTTPMPSIDEWCTVDSVKVDGYNIYIIENYNIIDGGLEHEFMNTFPNPNSKKLEYDDYTTLTLKRGSDSELALRKLLAPIDALRSVECVDINGKTVLGVSYR